MQKNMSCFVMIESLKNFIIRHHSRKWQELHLPVDLIPVIAL